METPNYFVGLDISSNTFAAAIYKDKESVAYLGEDFKNNTDGFVALIVMLDKEYGIRLSDPKEGRKIFESIEVMATYIAEKRTK